MKIVAGMGCIEDYENLVKSGADEVFCGYVPLEWNTVYSNNLPLNRREVMFYHVQMSTLEEMKILKNMVDVYHVPVTITINALFYNEQQLPVVAGIIADLMNIGFYEFIIADIGLIMYLSNNLKPLLLKRHKCHIHVSGELGEWNQNTIDLLLGDKFNNDTVVINRIIFHRKNTITDMKQCIDYIKEHCKSDKLAPECEAFILNEMCHFTGGFCNSLHCDEMCHMCHIPYEVVPVKNDGKKVDIEYYDVDSKLIGSDGCGLCSLWKLREAGISHLKVVGRGRSGELMARDIQSLNKILGFLEVSEDENDLILQIKKEIFKQNQCENECLSQTGCLGPCSKECYYLGDL